MSEAKVVENVENVEQEENVQVEEPTVLMCSDKQQEVFNIVKDMEKQFKDNFRTIYSLLKVSIKETTKMEKKKQRKNKDPNRQKRQPTGFARPVHVSDELADFIGIERGGLICRADVVKKIDNFANENNLKRPENKRQINLEPDSAEPLRTLLGLSKDSELDYFNLQTYLKPHYPKKEVVEKVETGNEAGNETKTTVKEASAAAVAEAAANIGGDKKKTVKKIRKRVEA